MRPLTVFTRPFPMFAVVLSLLALPCGHMSAADVSTTQDVSLEGMQFLHPCSTEMVTLHGSMRISYSTTTNGDDVFTTLHIDTHGVSATTSVAFPGEQPRKYVNNETDNETMHFRLSDGPTTQQLVTHRTFLRTGETDGIVCCGDDFLCHITLHVTFVNGSTTALPSNLSAECK